MVKFQIRDRLIAPGEPVYFIAEIGLNHNGDLDLAVAMIESAGRTGAEAVKFQTYKTETLADPVKNPELYRIFKQSELEASDYLILKEKCLQNNLAFISTPFDESSVEMLYDIGVDAFKIASSDLTNYPLLRRIASFNLAVVMSTGMGFLSEVVDAINILESNGSGPVIPLHCVSSYPPEDYQLNLRAIQNMKEALGRAVGYSDHYIGDLAVISPVILGAPLIEKHFTLDKNLEGPDQRLSADEGELRTIIQRTRSVETLLGDGIKKPSSRENNIRSLGRTGLYASHDLEKGSLITREDLVVSRPEGETPSSMIDQVIGKTTSKRIKAGSPISLNTLKKTKNVLTKAH